MEKDIILINKPVGITSFDIIRKLRHQTGIRKMGHAGTLDPLASGLMIVGINSGTKKLEQFLKLPKVYIADILLGESRTTGDMEGKIIEEKFVETIEESKIEKVLKSMVGIHEIAVPRYSAIKVDGKPLYKYAREGIEPPRIPVKSMEIFSIKLLNSKDVKDRYLLTVEIGVSSGSYIRSLAEEIGRRFDYPAVLAGLQRTSIGEYKLEDAQEIKDVKIG